MPKFDYRSKSRKSQDTWGVVYRILTKQMLSTDYKENWNSWESWVAEEKA